MRERGGEGEEWGLLECAGVSRKFQLNIKYAKRLSMLKATTGYIKKIHLSKDCLGVYT